MEIYCIFYISTINGIRLKEYNSIQFALYPQRNENENKKLYYFHDSIRN